MSLHVRLSYGCSIVSVLIVFALLAFLGFLIQWTLSCCTVPITLKSFFIAAILLRFYSLSEVFRYRGVEMNSLGFSIDFKSHISTLIEVILGSIIDGRRSIILLSSLLGLDLKQCSIQRHPPRNAPSIAWLICLHFLDKLICAYQHVRLLL